MQIIVVLLYPPPLTSLILPYNYVRVRFWALTSAGVKLVTTVLMDNMNTSAYMAPSGYALVSCIHRYSPLAPKVAVGLTVSNIKPVQARRIIVTLIFLYAEH